MIEVHAEFPQREVIQANAVVDNEEKTISEVIISAKPEITGVTASVDNETGTPYVDITETGTGTDFSFDLAFHNLKGEQGEQGIQGETGAPGQDGQDGADGQSAVITGATASVSNTVGIPNVTVMSGGTSLSRNFHFAFENLKGDKGDKGDTVSAAWGTISGTLSDQTDLQTELTNLQDEIDTINLKQNVADIVGTYAELQDYDTSTLTVNDEVGVLQDEMHDGAYSVYTWDGSSFTYRGSTASSYTKSETDTLLNNKANKDTAVTHTADTAVGSSSQPVYIDSSGVAIPTTWGIESPRFDGRFVQKFLQISTSTSVGSTTHSLADYLPNNGRDYEVIFELYVSIASGTTHLIVSTKEITGTAGEMVNTADCFRVIAVANANSRYQWNHMTLPIGTSRNVYIRRTSAASTAVVNALGYRRIGTNQ